jgi:ATP/maltotriose-dependent transcriptional regulator MalT
MPKSCIGESVSLPLLASVIRCGQTVARSFPELRAVLTRSLTLVSAPAGFGKTTILAQWISET